MADSLDTTARALLDVRPNLAGSNLSDRGPIHSVAVCQVSLGVVADTDCPNVLLCQFGSVVGGTFGHVPNHTRIAVCICNVLALSAQSQVPRVDTPISAAAVIADVQDEHIGRVTVGQRPNRTGGGHRVPVQSYRKVPTLCSGKNDALIRVRRCRVSQQGLDGSMRTHDPHSYQRVAVASFPAVVHAAHAAGFLTDGFGALGDGARGRHG